MAVHTSTYQYVLPCTCTVQGGTRRYMVVQEGTWQYNERYKEVHEGTRQYILVHTSMYRLVLHGAMWYKEVHGGTGRYIAVQ